MKRAAVSPAPPKPTPSVEKAEFPPLTATCPSLLVNGSDKSLRELVGALLDIGSQVHELRMFLAGRMGVSEPQYRVMIAIAQLQKSDGVSVGAVAENLAVTPNFVTMEVRKLEAMDLIKKLPNPEDGRGVLLHLSRKGRSSYLAVIETIQLINNTMYSDLNERDLLLILKVSRTIVKNGQRALDIAHAQTRNDEAPRARANTSRPKAQRSTV